MVRKDASHEDLVSRWIIDKGGEAAFLLYEVVLNEEGGLDHLKCKVLSTEIYSPRMMRILKCDTAR